QRSAGERGSRTARHDRHAMRAGIGKHRGDLVRVARQDGDERFLAVGCQRIAVEGGKPGGIRNHAVRHDGPQRGDDVGAMGDDLAVGFGQFHASIHASGPRFAKRLSMTNCVRAVILRCERPMGASPEGRLTLARLEAGILLVNDVHTALAAYDAAVLVALLERAERVANFHDLKALFGPSGPAKRRGSYAGTISLSTSRKSRDSATFQPRAGALV